MTGTPILAEHDILRHPRPDRGSKSASADRRRPVLCQTKLKNAQTLALAKYQGREARGPGQRPVNKNVMPGLTGHLFVTIFRVLPSLFLGRTKGGCNGHS